MTKDIFYMGTKEEKMHFGSQCIKLACKGIFRATQKK